jgi:hypothetical protein
LRKRYRPFFQVVIKRKIVAPIANGNHPPWVILALLAPRKVASNASRGTQSNAIRRKLHFHSRRAAKTSSSVVAIIAKVTAIPYALARASLLRKPRTREIHPMASSVLI